MDELLCSNRQPSIAIIVHRVAQNKPPITDFPNELCIPNIFLIQSGLHLANAH